jgi:hypothetical protein
MYEAWEENSRPFFPTEAEYQELRAFCTQEPQAYTLSI